MFQKNTPWYPEGIPNGVAEKLPMMFWRNSHWCFAAIPTGVPWSRVFLNNTH